MQTHNPPKVEVLYQQDTCRASVTGAKVLMGLAAVGALGSIIPSVETTRLAKRIGVPGGYRQDPADVAVLLNDAKAALLSDRAFAKACVARALDLLHEEPAPESGRSISPQGGLAGWQVRRAVAYIEAHLESTIRVKDLAALTRLSPSHFSRAFKRSFGQAPMTYVTRQRVELAQRLLLTTEDSVCQISLACGMCDQAHLTRVFRRVVGDSPTAWRRRHAVGPPPRPATSRDAADRAMDGGDGFGTDG